MKAYDPAFYNALTDTSLPAAERVWPMVLDLAPIGSVVDVGCGNGSWLRAVQAHGVSDVLGIDGPWIKQENLKIDPAHFCRMPLEEPIQVHRRFDLAVSMEVAEHLSPERASSFVRDLTDLAPLVLFSAAIPGQGGVNHINEQWPSYWADFFAARGYRAIDSLRPRLLSSGDVTWWYAQNVLLFASNEGVERWPKLVEPVNVPPPPLVHPELYRLMYGKAHPTFGEWLKMGSAALRRSLKRTRGASA